LIKNQIPNNLFVGKDYLCLLLESIDGSSRFPTIVQNKMD